MINTIITLTLIIINATDFGFSNQDINGIWDTGINSHRNGKFGYEYIFSGWEIEEVSHEGVYYSCLNIGDLEVYGKTGAPQLYRKSFILVVPPGGEFNIEVKFRDLNRYRLNYPLEPVPRWEGDRLSYERDEVEYTGEEVMRWEVSEVYQLGYWEVVRVSVYPMSYSGEYLEIAGRVELEVAYGSDYQSGLISSPSWDRIMRGMVINPEYLEIFKLPREVEWGIDQLRDRHPYYRISVLEDGMYEIRGSDLEGEGVDLTSIDPSTIRMLAGPSEALSWDVNDTIYDSFPLEIPILLYDGGDGRFDSGDRIVWYGQSITGYDRNSAMGVNYLYHSPWSDTGVYWLTWGGQPGVRIDSVSSHSPGGAYYQSSFEDTIHLEKDSLNPSQSGLRFIQSKIYKYYDLPLISYPIPFTVSGYSDSAFLNVMVYTSRYDSHQVQLRINGQLVADQKWFGKNEYDPAIITGPATGFIFNGSNQINLDVISCDINNDDVIMYDLSEVIYQRKYQGYHENLDFQPDTSYYDSLIQFKLTGFNLSDLIVLNISNSSGPVNVNQIINYQINQDTADICIYYPPGSRYCASSDLNHPVDIRIADPYSLKNLQGADYLILSDAKFESAVDRFVIYRKDNLPGNLQGKVLFVSVQEIYDNFGYGQTDPTAIRNFLKWTYYNWSSIPAYVLFLGTGTFDYRNIMNLEDPANIVPAHEQDGWVTESPNLRNNDLIDDWFVYFDSGAPLGMAIGRITVDNQIQARQILDKIINYENQTSKSYWNTRIMIMADDEYGSRVSQNYQEYQHTYYAEQISEQIPEYFQPVRLYLMNYLGTNQVLGPPYNYDPGSKPAASIDLIEELNKGIFLWIYFGHGSPTVLTHEEVFVNPDDVNSLENELKIPVAFFGSCGVGAFDQVNSSSLADAIQSNPDNGVLFCWASSRESFPQPNKLLAEELLHHVINLGYTPGEAALMVKNYLDRGHRIYISFGDPASIVLTDTGSLDLSLYAEQSVRSLSELSGGGLEFSGGSGLQLNTATLNPDQLVEVDTVNNQQLYVLEGEIPGDSFGNGWVGVIVVPPQRPDSHDYIHRAVPNPGDFLHYASDQFIPGLSIYQGIFPVEDDRFEVSFTTPAGINGSDPGSEYRDFMIYAYAWNEQQEARGYLELPSSGEDMGLSGDSSAPQVYLISGGRVISDSGEVVGDPMKAELVMEDPSGINLTPLPDYVMVMQIDDGELDTMLSREFVYDMGSTTRGRVKREIDFENDGDHEILLVVSDNVGNRGYYSWYLEVEGGITPELTQVMNYPNPMEESTDFTFILTGGVASVTIEIYTIGGRMIREIGPVEVSSGFNAIHWEGRDEEGDQPSNGVYFYRIVADWSDPESPGTEKELVEIEKLFICR